MSGGAVIKQAQRRPCPLLLFDDDATKWRCALLYLLHFHVEDPNDILNSGLLRFGTFLKPCSRFSSFFKFETLLFFRFIYMICSRKKVLDVLLVPAGSFLNSDLSLVNLLATFDGNWLAYNCFKLERVPVLLKLRIYHAESLHRFPNHHRPPQP